MYFDQPHRLIIYPLYLHKKPRFYIDHPKYRLQGVLLFLFHLFLDRADLSVAFHIYLFDAVHLLGEG